MVNVAGLSLFLFFFYFLVKTLDRMNLFGSVYYLLISILNLYEVPSPFAHWVLERATKVEIV